MKKGHTLSMSEIQSQMPLKKVQKNVDIAREKQTRNYDLKAKADKLFAGDRVLVKV